MACPSLLSQLQLRTSWWHGQIAPPSGIGSWRPEHTVPPPEELAASEKASAVAERQEVIWAPKAGLPLPLVPPGEVPLSWRIPCDPAGAGRGRSEEERGTRTHVAAFIHFPNTCCAQTLCQAQIQCWEHRPCLLGEGRKERGGHCKCNLGRGGEEKTGRKCRGVRGGEGCECPNTDI